MSQTPTIKQTKPDDEILNNPKESKSYPNDQARPVKPQSIPLLPRPVPSSGPPTLPSLRYPHLSLPLNTPPYLFDKFTPSPLFLAMLMDMGVTESAATKALYWTGNSCIELASNWVFERSEESLKTPLEVEIKMLKADLDMKEEESRERMLSSDSGVHFMYEDEIMLNTMRMMEQGEQMSEMSEDYEMYKLVVVINQSNQFSSGQLTELVSMTTAHMMTKLFMNEFGDEQLDMWEAMGQQVVLMEGENTKHLVDLRLAAECLGLDCVVEGKSWDNSKRLYGEVMMLAIWGEENDLHNVVGRLVKVV